MSGQLVLLPSAPPEVRRENLPVEVIDGWADAVPSIQLQELIRDLGLLQSVVVVPGCFGSYRLVEGRRRCKAIWQLAEAGEWPTPPRVDAIVIDDRQTTRRQVRGGLTLALHATRSPSPASELQAIENILRAGDPESEAITVKEIAAQTGISLQTVRRRLRLRALIPALRLAFDEGKITPSVAEAAAHPPEAQQNTLEQRLEAHGRISLAEVRDLARGQTATATAQLPGSLFEERKVAWEATVLGHLAAALGAIPSGDGCDLLRHAITNAVGLLEMPGTQGAA